MVCTPEKEQQHGGVYEAVEKDLYLEKELSVSESYSPPNINGVTYKILILPRREAIVEPYSHALLQNRKEQTDHQHKHDPCDPKSRPTAWGMCEKVDPSLWGSACGYQSEAR
jgi:hypothetical protein